MKAIRNLASVLLVALLLSTCEVWGSRDNPADPGAKNYPGYDTVTNPGAIAAANSTNGGTLSGATLTATKVVGATAYGLVIAASAAALETAPLFTKADYASNVMDISASGIADKTTYWWKVQAKIGGTAGAWSAKASFTTSWQPAATPTFSPEGTTYSSDQSVTISCTTTGAVIYYTNDRTTPTTASTLYTVAISVPANTTTTLKAIATAPLYSTSAVGTAVYNALVTMLPVAGGSFNNGTSMVTLSSFTMSKYEVTQAQYATVTGNSPSNFTGDTSRPVEQVTWYDSVEFCNLLSTREGRTPAYTITGRTPATGYPITSATVTMDLTKNGYRLPTEAEWEYAARGGASTHSYTYAGSSTIDGVAWYYSNSGNTTHPVGGKTANELGLFDMSGNVCEWCYDWYGDHPSGAQTDPTGAASGSGRVVRGGSWTSYSGYCTVSDRYSYFPGSLDLYYRYFYFGFRVVRRP